MDTYATAAAPAHAAAAASDLRQALDTALAQGITTDEIHRMIDQCPPVHRVATPDDIVRVLDSGARRNDAVGTGPVTPNYDPANADVRKVTYLNRESGETKEVIYRPDAVPDGLIDLPTAARKYDIPVRTLHAWVVRGKIPRRGRVRAKAAGGGYVLTDDAAIPICRDNPRKRGPKCA